MANSVTTHKATPVRLLVCSLVAWAKSIPVTIPKRAAILCSNMATKLESKITLSNVYLYSAPPAIDVIQFPGSI